jgi:hypothetical protein
MIYLFWFQTEDMSLNFHYDLFVLASCQLATSIH